MIQLNNISKYFPKRWKVMQSFMQSIAGIMLKEVSKNTIHALDRISCRVDKDEIVGLIGPNGSGKSTLLRVMGRIYAPTSGTIKSKGIIKAVINLKYGIIHSLSMKDNLMYLGIILGMTRSEIDAKYDTIAEFAGLSDQSTKITHFSEGMKDRLIMSVVLHTNFDFLLLDEMLTMADESFKNKCIEHLRLISKKKGIIITSHDLELISKLCKRVIILSKGEIVYDGNVTEGLKVYRESICKSKVMI